MVDIIAKFNYNNKDYIIGNNNNQIEFYLKDENNFTSSLSEKEINICMQILDSITIDKKTSVYLYNKAIGNNIYQIFYDIKTRLHWWILLNGNNDNQEDNIELNFLYNNMPDAYYLDTQEDNIENGKNNNDKRFIKLLRVISPILVTVLISPLIAFAEVKGLRMYYEYKFKREIVEGLDDERIQSVSDLNKLLSDSDVHEEKLEETADLLRDEINSKQEYNWYNTEEAIESNANLTHSEKDFLKKLKFLFDENHEYMNMDMVNHNLKTLKITYSKNNSFLEKIFESAGGAYFAELNHIYIPDANNFEETDLRIIIHELLHMIQISSTGYSEELAVTIAQREILQRLIENGEVKAKAEYYDYNGALTNLGLGYPTDHKLLYLTFKLISPKARKQYLFQTDEKIIAEELMSIDTSNNYEEKQNRAYRIVDYLNQLKGYDSSKEQQPEELCFKELQYYYYCKYGKPIEQDLDAVLAFYDDYGYTFTTEDGEKLPLLDNVNKSNLGGYVDDLDEYEISNAIKKSVIGDDENVYGITITAKPANIFFDLDKTATCYWMNDDKTVSKNIDTSVSENYEKEIENRRAENEKWKNR